MSAVSRLHPTLILAALLCAARSAHAQAPAVTADQRAATPIFAPDPRPALHFPRVVGASPRRPLVFRVPATGRAPLTFSCPDLPSGLRLDPKTGVVSGQMPAPGTFTAHVAVQGPAGRAEAVWTFVCGERALARTPPMGWDSFDVYGEGVSDAAVRRAADALLASGLAAHGYSTLIVDEAWQGLRDKKTGRLRPNKRFPDMAGLAAYLHARGLKLGLSSAPTVHTCAGFAGSQGHETEDAQTYAAWGVDYLKYDWCPLTIDKQKPPPDQKAAFALMRRALDGSGRDVVYAISTFARDDVWTWAAPVAGANSWVSTDAMYDLWPVLAGNGFGHPNLAPDAGPGHWNDPGPLLAGRIGYPALHLSHLTPPEQMTQMSLWSLQAAPLILSCDLSHLDPNALHPSVTALLTNDEVLTVDQDPLGRAGTQVAADGTTRVWSRPLADGTLAVGLFNLGNTAGEVSISWPALGLSGPQPVRDLWLHQDLGEASGTFTAQVPPHGVALVRIGTARPPAAKP